MKHPANPLLLSHSRPRQAPPHAPILLALLRLVPIPDQPPRLRHRALRDGQEAVRARAQADAGRQVRRALPRRGAGGGRQGHGRGAEVVRGGEAARVCGIYGAG